MRYKICEIWRPQDNVGKRPSQNVNDPPTPLWTNESRAKVACIDRKCKHLLFFLTKKPINKVLSTRIIALAVIIYHRCNVFLLEVRDQSDSFDKSARAFRLWKSLCLMFLLKGFDSRIFHFKQVTRYMYAINLVHVCNEKIG